MKKYTLWNIVDEAVEQYGMSNFQSDRKAYYYHIRRALDEHKADNGMSVWDSGAVCVEGQKKDRHLFSAGILNAVLYDWCKEYFEVRAGEEYKALKRFRQEVDEIEKKFQVEMSEQGYDDDGRSYVSEEELRFIRLERMVSAIFELHFTPFDGEALKEDLEVIRNTDPQNIQMSEMDALNRYNNGHSYYKVK